MKLDLGNIINYPGERVNFDFAMDLGNMEINSQKPAQQSIAVSGNVSNVAGVLKLHMQLDTVLTSVCDRCLKVFPNPKSVIVDNVVAEEIFDEELDDVILMENDCIDLEEIAETAFVLALDSKTLCREDCRGLCPQCGADLNLGDCGCETESDPRMAVFRQLLKDKNQ